MAVPGVLAGYLLFPRGHALDGWLARHAVAASFGMLLLGVSGALATKLHWRFDSFLVLFAAVYAAACALLGALVWRRRSAPVETAAPCDATGPALPRLRPGSAGLLLLALAATLWAARLPGPGAWLSWWQSLALGLGVSGAVVAGVVTRARRGSPPAADPPSGTRPAEAWSAAGLWLLVALATWNLMLVAQQRRLVDSDDATHVGRSVDFLTGAPLDRYEPCLGQELPTDANYALATVSLLTAVHARATGLPPAALQHTVLPPLFVLAGVGALVALFSALLERQRLLVPLAVAAALAVLTASSDGHRSVSHFLFYRPAQPKSLHLLLAAPLQLASLVLLYRRPGRAHLAAALGFQALGYLIHPWSTLAGGVFAGSFAAVALLGREASRGPLVAVLATVAALAGLHLLQARLAWFDTASYDTPAWPIQLAAAGDGYAARLDAEATLGHYSLLRIGVLALPWVLLLGARFRAALPFAAVSAAALALAYAEPASALLAELVPRSLLWRTRWIVPSAANAGLLAVCALWVATEALRRPGGRGAVSGLLGLAVALGGIGLLVRHNGSEWLARDGPVEHSTKLSAATRWIGATLDRHDDAPYVLTRPRSPLSYELCQLLPGVRLITSGPVIVEWYYGKPEETRRVALLERFYEGRMSSRGFASLLAEFPVRWAVVEGGRRRVRNQRALLRKHRWQRVRQGDGVELWRADRGPD